MLVIWAFKATQRESFSRNGAQKNRLLIIVSSTFVVPMMPLNSAERFCAPVTFGSILFQSCWIVLSWLRIESV